MRVDARTVWWESDRRTFQWRVNRNWKRGSLLMSGDKILPAGSNPATPANLQSSSSTVDVDAYLDIDNCR